MNTNFTQAKSWINSAIKDIERVLTDLEQIDYARVAFTSQFAVEKLNKAILSFMGLKIEKTHTPSKILKNVINEELIEIEQETQKIVKFIIQYSEFFEKQGTKTRYGIFKDNELIFPEEIYKNFEDIKDFIINLKKVINCQLTFLKEIFHQSNKKFENLDKLKDLKEKLKKWI